MVKFPDVEVKLVGEDGNAFAILGRVQKALKRGGASQEEVAEFMREATSGDYDNLLQVVMRWVEVEQPRQKIPQVIPFCFGVAWGFLQPLFSVRVGEKGLPP